MATLAIRTEPEVERALDSLASEGYSRSEAARAAILETDRAHRRVRLRAEADELRNDPDDDAASRELAGEMDASRVMVEQMTAIDPQTHLGEFAGRLDSSEMHAVDGTPRRVCTGLTGSKLSCGLPLVW